MSTSTPAADSLESSKGRVAAAVRPQRVPFIDDLRGLAVVFMMLWHSVDAWVPSSLRSSWQWAPLRLLGGMAAPLFIFLAGTAVAMKIAADGAREPALPRRSSLRALVARGLGIVVLGYGLRLQMWLIDAGAIVSPSMARAWLPWLGALVAFFVAAQRFGAGARVWRWLMAGVVLFAFARFQLDAVAPERAVGLLRVDVLQCIGACIVVTALFGNAIDAFARPSRALLVAIVVALATLPLSSLLPLPIPGPVMGYLARWSTPEGVQPIAMFPLFPWLAYAFAGVAFGSFLSAAKSAEEVASKTLRLAAVGVVCVLFSRESFPPVYRIAAEFPASGTLLRGVFRIGLAFVFSGLLFVLLRRFRDTPLRTFGRTSLLIYWVHLSFTYGLGGRWLRDRLDYVQWLAAFAVLVVAMWVVAWIRLRAGRRLRTQK